MLPPVILNAVKDLKKVSRDAAGMTVHSPERSKQRQVQYLRSFATLRMTVGEHGSPIQGL